MEDDARLVRGWDQSRKCRFHVGVCDTWDNQNRDVDLMKRSLIPTREPSNARLVAWRTPCPIRIYHHLEWCCSRLETHVLDVQKASRQLVGEHFAFFRDSYNKVESTSSYPFHRCDVRTETATTIAQMLKH